MARYTWAVKCEAHCARLAGLYRRHAERERGAWAAAFSLLYVAVSVSSADAIELCEAAVTLV